MAADKSLRVLITGASSGIGRALAEHYARDGHVVGAVARRAELLDDLAREYATISPMPCDITDGTAVEDLLHRFALEHGGLDLVYANAGIGQHAPEEGWDPEKARQIAMINIVGTTNTIAPAAGIMVEQGFGRIVGISSLAGHCPLPSAAAYGASKAWLKFYLESLDMDLMPYGVRCTVVMPGYVATALADRANADSSEVTSSARRAATRIARGVERGERVIRFPRRVSLLARLAGFLPPSIRAEKQRKRLAKRQRARRE